MLTTAPEFAYSLLRSLRTSSIAAIVDRLNPLLHIDPVVYLPPEITFEVFSYLDPHSLLRASTLSRSWRIRALDPRLWRRLFGTEGWSANAGQVKDFEQTQRARFGDSKGKARARTSEEITDAESKSAKRRVRGRTAFGDDVADTVMESSFEAVLDSPRLWDEQHGTVEADEDEKMEDVSPLKTEHMSPVNDIHPINPSSPLSTRSKLKKRQSSSDALNPPTKPSLLLSSNGGELSMNWQYLYKQKRRLEDNWNKGRFKNFQLPHPSHAHEAHAECVYTIQYTGKHLVSGSRDKTLRIWDLDTQRLMVPPLRGHDASVLCLQFDDRPDQDIVVSGGSDCHVILWQFSTGKMLRRLERAHSESVLNLRFDDRYLVTCSKDKTIKVWNREILHPTDTSYPSVGGSTSARFPSYIINMDNLLENKHDLKPLKEYSLLMTLHGHTAAVNAIQILDYQIVSASGDRNVKVWDVHTGQCLKTIPGHLKGIACVQFDGRRIVSGSSDETVRIFDRITGAEVACLRGHANLVRTVQARFGDIPGSALDDETEARAVDSKFFTAKLTGALPKEMSREQRRARNAGSSDPKDIFALGAKLPPGGGGSRWARIVSGSYDETVIIWKRNSDGKWTPAHQLYQWEAVLHAGGQPRYPATHRHPPPHLHHAAASIPAAATQSHVHAHQAHAQAVQQAVQAQHATALVHNAHAQLTQAHMSLAHAQHIVNQHQTRQSNQTAASNAISSDDSGTAASASSNSAEDGSAQNGSAQPSTSSSSTVVHSNQQQQQPQQQQQQQQVQNTSNSSTTVQPQSSQWAGTIAHHPTQTMPTQPSSSAQQTQATPSSSASTNHSNAPTNQHQTSPDTDPLPNNQNQQVANPVPGPAQSTPSSASQPQQQTQNPNQHPHAHGVGGANHTNSRVFKLQFDSRRIICCSQDPTIVGWDFANGDREIEEASRFFGEDW